MYGGCITRKTHRLKCIWHNIPRQTLRAKCIGDAIARVAHRKMHLGYFQRQTHREICMGDVIAGRLTERNVSGITFQEKLS
jgi:hypothetical protein